MDLSQSWISLYTSWNMAFVLFNYNDLDIIMPKLLIPSIINAESENFLGVRVISLWLTLNYFLFRKHDKKEIVGPANKTSMAKTWAAINKRYAMDLAVRDISKGSDTLTKSSKQWFSHPFYHFYQLAKNFLSS